LILMGIGGPNCIWGQTEKHRVLSRGVGQIT